VRLYPRVFADLLRVPLWSFLHFYLHMRIGQKEEFPPGPKVFAVNHPTVWDAFPILVYVRKEPLHVLVEEQVWSFAVPAFLFRLANQIVLYRSSEESWKTIEDSLFVLSRGHSILIAPEGERTAPDSRVRARRGVVRLALEGRASIVPVGVWIDELDIVMRPVHYTHAGQEYTVESYFPRFRADYGVMFGQPIVLEEYFGKPVSRQRYQSLANLVLERVRNLSVDARKLFHPER
jgi:1-acyl-sn-glycerol-3-phosphate acyltransferase